MPHPSPFKRIVVSGGTGFIGRHLLGKLVDRGYHPVVIARTKEKVDGLPDDLKGDLRFVELDLLDQSSVLRFIETERPTLLFHLAGTRGAGEGTDDASASCTELNVKATRYLLEVATRAGAGRIVIIGTAEEYGDQSGPLDETRTLKPSSAYGKSKAEATRIALYLHEHENCPVVNLRLFTVYGPHQPSGMFVSDAIDAAVKNVSFAMSEGTQQRDLVYIDDVTDALISAANIPGIEGRVFNLGSGRPIRLLDLARLIWRISKSTAPLNVGARPRKNEDMQVTWSDSSLAHQVLGWSPKVGLEMGLRATIEWAASTLRTP